VSGEEELEGLEGGEEDVVEEKEVGEAGGCVVYRGAVGGVGGWGVKGLEEAVADGGEVGETFCADFAGWDDDCGEIGEGEMGAGRDRVVAWV